MPSKRLSLGLRFSNSDFSYAVMEGQKSAPVIVEQNTIPYPKGYLRAQKLKWLLQEIEGLLGKHDVSIIVLKRFEGRSKGNSFEERVECEATAFIAAANCGKNAVFKKMGVTLAKDLGLKGKARLLKTELDTSVIVDYEEQSEKIKDAILCGWSELS